MIIAENLYKKYGNLEVLKGVSLQIKQGEVVAIVGPSGAGKTTLLQLIGTLDKPSNNDYNLRINQQNLKDLNDKELSKFRNRQIGFIFQFHQLLPEFTAMENVAIPAYIAGTDKAKADAKAIELLNLLGLQERIYHKPAALSGGEQQRVAVARALINNPAVIMADEPSGNLDSENAKQLHKLFFKLRDKFHQTFVIVTHNEELADMSDRKLFMKDGLIVENQ
jgi:lipoprotein-releasing system ATP-binding protein